jgi:ABC-type branched-subunit amino acid transport system ATPase component/ABC-type branched-subunit amino acid transport system permease subunit
VNLGSLLLGVLNGLVIGLLAVGLVLVYKANRFLNLANAQIGAVSAILLAKFVLDWGWSWWAAFPVCLAVGLLTAVAVERLVIAPLRRKTGSKVSLLLVTVGVTELLLALTYIPALGPDPDTLDARGYPVPFTSHLEVGGVVLGGQYLLIMVLAPLLVAGLGAFFRYSLLGKTIRAAASNPDAARLCGISTAKVSTISWAAAGVLSAVTAILKAPSEASLSAASLGPDLLLVTLGAAALGAFVSIPAALAGGLALGVAQQLTLAETANGGTAELVVFLLILFIVLARGRAIAAAFDPGSAGVEDRPPLRIPAAVANRALVRHRRVWLAAFSLAVAVLVPLLPYFRTVGHRFELATVVVYALVGVSLTMLVGWGGQVSLGQFALVGAGAFLAARLGAHGLSLVLLVLVAGALGAVVMVAVGLPALRVRGLTLAVTTLGLAVVAPEWLFRQHWFGSAQPFGLEVPAVPLVAGLGRPSSELAVYYVALAVLALAVVAAGALRRSVPGRLVVAVRDNERSAAAFGATPATLKLSLLAVSGLVAGAAGVLFAEAWRTVSAAQFDPDLSISVLAVPVVGGLGSLAGAVAGAAALYVPVLFLNPLLTGLFGSFGAQVGFQLALGGAGLVGVVMGYPTGIAGAAQRAFEGFCARLAAAGPAPAARSEAPLVAEGVEASVGGMRVLRGVSLELRPGEIVGLIGPNGAGKTTLLNVLSGVLRPDAGSVRIFGTEVAGLPAEYRASLGLARSFQDAALFPGLTVTETVQVALARRSRVGFLSSMLGAPWARAADASTRARATEILESLGLLPYADALTSELSTGTRRICDLAAQVAAEPEILLLDEPTAGVAQRDAEAFGPLLRRIRERLDCTVLVVEHDIPLLMGLCDRVYAMEEGTVIAQGTPEQIRANPTVVASYLGTGERALLRSGARRETRPQDGRAPVSTAPRRARSAAPTEPASRARPARRDGAPARSSFPPASRARPPRQVAS